MRGAESTITGTITINSATGVTLDGVKLLDETPWTNSIADNRTAVTIGGTGAHEIVNSVFERAPAGSVNPDPNGDRKSTRLNSITNAHLVCRLLLEKKKPNTLFL